MTSIGIIGYGYWGPNLVRNFAETPGTTVAAVSDLDPAKLRVQLVSQLQCGVTSGVIQGDDDRSLADGHWNGLSGKSKSARIVAQAAALRDPMIGKY